MVSLQDHVVVTSAVTGATTRRHRMSFIGGGRGACAGLRANAVSSAIVCASSTMAACNNNAATVVDSGAARFPNARTIDPSTGSLVMPGPTRRTTTHRLKAVACLLGAMDSSLDALAAWTCPEAAHFEATLLHKLLDVSRGEA